MQIIPFEIEKYDEVYSLWMSCKDTSFIAEADGKVVGTVLAGNDGRRGYVYHLCVAEDYRRQGIARKLVDAMLDGMKKEGISKVALVVFAKNDAANAFYEKIGWNKRDDLIYRNIALVNLERIDT